MYREEFESKEEAMSREWHLKRMTRQEKLRLIADADGKEEEHGAEAREAQRDLHGL